MKSKTIQPKIKSPLRIIARTPKGGAVMFNKQKHVWASYAVAGAADLPRPELLYAGAWLDDGRAVQFFMNRETGLVVVDVIDKRGKSGCEILRTRLLATTLSESVS